jgi:hypothetical protein
VTALSQYLTFRPYGDRLLTPAAKFWLSTARSLVFVTASVEALAWGYAGFSLARGELRWLISGLVAGMVFVLVWILSTSLIMVDRAWVEHSKAILVEQPANKRRKIGDAWILVTRIAMLLMLLAIAAPNLTRLVLDGSAQQTAYEQTKLSVTAFLAFLFAAMVLHKLFEPSAVRLYLSELLQQEYTRYLEGAFDEYLPTAERAVASRGVMSPNRLYEFLSNVWAPAQATRGAMANPFLTKVKYAPEEDHPGQEAIVSTSLQPPNRKLERRFRASSPLSTALTVIAIAFLLSYGLLIGVLGYRAVFQGTNRIAQWDWLTIATVHLLLVMGFVLLVAARHLREVRSQELERILVYEMLSRTLSSASKDPIAQERLLGNFTNRFFSGSMRGEQDLDLHFDPASTWIIQRLGAGDVIYAVPDGFEELEQRIENFLEERGATLHVLRTQVPTEVQK